MALGVKWEMRGGSRLATWTEKAINDSNWSISFGFLRPDRYPDKYGETVSSVAKKQEFGTRDIPARPFLRPATNSLKQLFPQHLAKLMKQNKSTMDQKIAQSLGEYAKLRVQSEIRHKQLPPNAPRTVEKKGFNNPLLDTRFMLDHVRYRTRKIGSK